MEHHQSQREEKGAAAAAAAEANVMYDGSPIYIYIYIIYTRACACRRSVHGVHDDCMLTTCVCSFSVCVHVSIYILYKYNIYIDTHAHTH